MEIIDGKKTYRYGGFWVRFVAHLIDGIVIFIAQSIVSYAFGSNMFFAENMTSPVEPEQFWNIYGSDFSLIIIAGILIDVVYYAGMQSSSKQATIGKMAFELKVVDGNGERISFLRGVGRYFSKCLSSIILMIGYIMAAFDSRKQALHDKIANTYVIYDREGK